MADPLTLLRDYKVGGKQVTLNGDVLIFVEDDVQFPCSTPTTFRALGGDGEPYTLGACWFMLRNADNSYQDYLVECKQNPNFQRVSLVDRKEMINYLTGVISTSKNIRAPSELPLPTPMEDSGDLTDSLSNKRSLSSSTSSKNEEPEFKKLKLSEPQDIELDEKLRESKEEMAKRLEKPKVKTIAPVPDIPVPELGAGMTADKINEIKRKLYKKKMATVGEIESINEKAKKDKSSFVEADAAVTKEIVSREKLLQTRATVLLSDTKRFNDLVKVMEGIFQKERERKKVKQQKQAEQQAKTSSYDRYNVKEKQFWRAKLKGNDAEEWDIDTRGTFAGVPGKLSDVLGSVDNNGRGGGSSSSRGKGEREKEKEKEKEREREKGKDKEKEKERERRDRPHERPASSIPRAPSAQRPHHRKHHSQGSGSNIPIIIVPSGLTSLITLYNAQDFLENAKWVPSMDKKNQGAKKEVMVTMQRRKDKDIVVPYQIVDNTTRFSHSDWERVVAVFAQGPSWQFKDWRWADPVDLFTHVRGFFLQYDDGQIPASIKSWNVKVLYVNRYKRHMDQTTVLDFWSTLDAFIARKKPNLVT